MVQEERDVSQALIQALARHPDLLGQVLDEAHLAPHVLAMWARRTGRAEIEKLAGWLDVGRRPDHYKPLLEVAASHLRAGDLVDALPVFRWAYQTWLIASVDRAAHARDGAKLLMLWGECLYLLGRADAARQRWLLALDLIADVRGLARQLQIMERVGAREACQQVVAAAVQRGLPGAKAHWLRLQRLAAQASDAGEAQRSVAPPQAQTEAQLPPSMRSAGAGVAVMADVANIDMLCGEQHGYDRSVDYGALLREAARYGPVRAKMAFVPDLPDTLHVRRHLEEVGFEIDLKTPKRSHGRVVANADTAMAAYAMRWVSDPHVARVELWTGDGDFLKVREAAAQVRPRVLVAYRSFEAGTAAGIRCLAPDWEPIGPQHLRSTVRYQA